MAVLKNRISDFMADSRSNMRVEENRRIAWQALGGRYKGQGKIRNISTAGMLLETAAEFKLFDRCTFSFDTDLGAENFIPQKGSVVWYKQIGRGSRYLCGISFVEPAEYVLSKLQRRVQKRVRNASKEENMFLLMNTLFVTFTVSIVGYIVWQSAVLYQDLMKTNAKMSTVISDQTALTRTYSELYLQSEIKLAGAHLELSETQKLYQESQGILTDVSQELQTTQAILKETETMLLAAQSQLASTEGDKAALSQELVQLSNFQEMAAELETKNKQLNNEMSVIEKRLKFYQGDAANLKEAQELMKLYREKMTLVKSRIKMFKQEALEMRANALNEKDRIQLILGNNGYFVKNGSVVKVDEAKYESATLDDVGQPATQPNAKVKVDVNFVD